MNNNRKSSLQSSNNPLHHIIITHNPSRQPLITVFPTPPHLLHRHIRPVHNLPILFSEILLHEIVLVNERGQWAVLVVAAGLRDPSVGCGDRAVLMDVVALLECIVVVIRLILLRRRVSVVGTGDDAAGVVL